MKLLRRSLVVIGVLAAALAAENARASEPQLECTTQPSGGWNVTVNGPTSVPCPDGGECTALDFQIVENAGRRPSRAAIFVEHDVDVVEPAADQVEEPCVGDRRTRFGLNDCSHKTVAIDLMRGQRSDGFQIVARGLRDIVDSAMVVKGPGRSYPGGREGCRIASLGSVAFHPNQQVTTNQQISYKGCVVTIPTDPVTGEGGTATIMGDNCVFVANAAPVSAGELKINDTSVGAISFGDGSLSSSSAACTTKLVNRRLYTWCNCGEAGASPLCPVPVP